MLVLALINITLDTPFFEKGGVKKHQEERHSTGIASLRQFKWARPSEANCGSQQPLRS